MDHDSLWSFATTVYQEKGVAAACLALQSQCETDIPMLFAVAFACGKDKKQLEEDVIKLQRLTRPWQTNVVRALRQIRTQLKNGPHPAPNTKTNELREKVKAVELAAEKIQIEMMQSWIDDLKTIHHKNSSAKLLMIIESITIFVTANCDTVITPNQHEHIHCIGDAAFLHIHKSGTSS